MSASKKKIFPETTTFDKRMNVAFSVDVSKAAATKARVHVFETELSLVLTTSAELLKRWNQVKDAVESGGELETRFELVSSYLHIKHAPDPDVLVQEAIPKFMDVVRPLVESLKSKALSGILRLLELELHVFAAFLYYDAIIDRDAAFERLKKEIKRLVEPRREKPSETDPVAMEINLRVDDVLRLCRMKGFDDDGEAMIEELANLESTLKCGRRLVVELQERLFGTPRWPLVVKKQGAAPAAAALAAADPVAALAAADPVAAAVTPSKTQNNRPASSAKRARVLAERDVPVEIVGHGEAAAAATPRKNGVEPMTEAEMTLFDEDNHVTTSSAQMSGSRTRFTVKEDEALLAGVEKYGEGRWKQILYDALYAEVFKSVKERTATSLKDRYRVLKD